MKRQIYQHKKWLFLSLFAAMILSGFQTEQIAACSDVFSQDLPLNTTKLRQTMAMPYHDALTAEILGRKNSETIIAGSIRNRGKAIYQMADTALLTGVSAFSPPFLCTSSALRRRNQQLYICSWIIRYIHDQDGEKDDAFPLKI